MLMTTLYNLVSRDAHFILLSSMQNDIIGKFKYYSNAQYMWNQLKIAYVDTKNVTIKKFTLKYCEHTQNGY